MAKIIIDIATQRLRLKEGDEVVMDVAISSAKNGGGEAPGSECTPRGSHIIRAKIGADFPLNSVFIGRRPTGEIYSPELDAIQPGRDWVLSRILWLSGTEIGINRLGGVDSMRRYIYIHGTPDSEPMGIPMSHGCVRMRNDQLIELFDRVAVGTHVQINGVRC
ncbi:MAG: L,D-transpeptidase [Gammaproteobacteria bacterium]|nr:L,D-transpeptidase [Gammaproteobacteria bacterium]